MVRNVSESSDDALDLTPPNNTDTNPALVTVAIDDIVEQQDVEVVAKELVLPSDGDRNDKGSGARSKVLGDAFYFYQG
jgi:hypothetical protein